ncbi:hypothetical protein [Sorangium sp. So ce1000]|uniref:hypothetical protein n=1 Tax=Sorangium sp. So ce1000 TaxID=3133325 RepID=UPI003F61A755
MLPAASSETATAFRKLRKHAAAAWDEDEGTYKAVFAPHRAVQAPKKRRSKATPAEAPAAAPA